MALLLRPLTPAEQEAVVEASRLALDCYNAACADPKFVAPSYLHAAFLKIKSSLEAK